MDIIECHSKKVKRVLILKKAKEQEVVEATPMPTPTRRGKGKRYITTKASKIEIQAKLNTFHRKRTKGPQWEM